MLLTAVERLLADVDRSGLPGSCWLWRGCLNRGYGLFFLRGQHYYAHRVSYEHFVGPIPAGLQIDHLCRVPSCVNPDHLEAVSGRVNTLRGIGPTALNAAKTHCARGHEFTLANTYILDGTNWRACRACALIRQKQYDDRARGGPPPGPRTHCPQGHAYDESNTYHRADGSRKCRTCNKERMRRCRAEEAAA